MSVYPTLMAMSDVPENFEQISKLKEQWLQEIAKHYSEQNRDSFRSLLKGFADQHPKWLYNELKIYFTKKKFQDNFDAVVTGWSMGIVDGVFIYRRGQKH